MTDIYGTETITHWVRSGQSGYSTPVVAAPVEIYGKWVDTLVRVRSSDGVQEVVASGVIYTGSEVSIGDFVFLGSSEAEDPMDVVGAKEVLRVNTNRSRDGSRVLYTVFLKG